jgi:hypothetical protein
MWTPLFNTTTTLTREKEVAGASSMTGTHPSRQVTESECLPKRSVAVRPSPSLKSRSPHGKPPWLGVPLGTEEFEIQDSLNDRRAERPDQFDPTRANQHAAATLVPRIA